MQYVKKKNLFEQGVTLSSLTAEDPVWTPTPAKNDNISQETSFVEVDSVSLKDLEATEFATAETNVVTWNATAPATQESTPIVTLEPVVEEAAIAKVATAIGANVSLNTGSGATANARIVSLDNTETEEGNQVAALPPATSSLMQTSISISVPQALPEALSDQKAAAEDDLVEDSDVESVPAVTPEDTVEELATTENTSGSDIVPDENILVPQEDPATESPAENTPSLTPENTVEELAPTEIPPVTTLPDTETEIVSDDLKPVAPTETDTETEVVSNDLKPAAPTETDTEAEIVSNDLKPVAPTEIPPVTTLPDTEAEVVSNDLKPIAPTEIPPVTTLPDTEAEVVSDDLKPVAPTETDTEAEIVSDDLKPVAPTEIPPVTTLPDTEAEIVSDDLSLSEQNSGDDLPVAESNDFSTFAIQPIIITPGASQVVDVPLTDTVQLTFSANTGYQGDSLTLQRANMDPGVLVYDIPEFKWLSFGSATTPAINQLLADNITFQARGSATTSLHNAQIGTLYTGHKGADKVEIYLYANAKVGTLYAGNGEILGDHVLVQNQYGEIGTLYGGGDGSGSTTVAHVNFVDIQHDGGTIGMLYGGGSHFNSTIGSTYITISPDYGSPVVTGDVFGGGSGGSKVTGEKEYSEIQFTCGTRIAIENATVQGNVYGGGSGINSNVTHATYIKLGHDSQIGGKVFGGGKNGAVVGSTMVHTDNMANGSVEELYGGGNLAAVNGDTLLDFFNAGVIDWTMFAGGYQSAVGGKSQIKLGGNTVLTGNIYAGGNGVGATSTSTDITTWAMEDEIPTVKLQGVAFGGGKDGAVVDNTFIRIYLDHIGEGHIFYGGGDNANVNEKTNISIGNTTNSFTIYGGGNNGGKVLQGTNIEFWGGTVGSVYGGGNGSGSTVIGETIVTVGGSVTGVIYGGGNNADVDGNTNVTFTWGNADLVYGGGNNANVSGISALTIGGNAELAYAGCNNAISGSNKLTVSGGYSTNIYGGGSSGSSVTNITVDIIGGNTVNLYGGGNGDQVNGDITMTLSGGNITGRAFAGGGEGSTVFGNVTWNLQSGVEGDIYGGGYKSNVHGNTTLNISANINGNVFGGGDLGEVFGKINITLSAGCDANGKTIYGGGSGNVNTASQTGTAIKITVNSDSFAEAYNIVLGNYNDAIGEDSNVFGDIELDLQKNGAGTTAATGRIYVGGYRVAEGITTVTGKATLTIGSARLTNTLLAGGFASNNGAVVIIEGGSSLTLTGTINTGFTMLGGWADGSGARSEIGTLANAKGVTLTVTGNSQLTGTITGSGYATNGGTATVYGDSTIDVNSATTGSIFGGGYAASSGTAQLVGNSIITVAATAKTGVIYGGGYGTGGTARNTGDSSITVNGNATINYIYGGGYAAASGTVETGGNVSITLAGYTLGTVGIYGGGRSSGNGNVSIGSVLNKKEVVITLTNSRFKTVFGGGAATGSGSSTIYGNTKITVAGGYIAELYGAGHASNTGSALVSGDTDIQITGGSFGLIFGGGNAAGNGTSEVTGNTNIFLDCNNAISVNGIYGGGRFTAFVGGDTNITLTGNGNNLEFVGQYKAIVGGSPIGENTGTDVGGNRNLIFQDFNGKVDAKIAYFDTISIDKDSSVHWKADIGSYATEVHEWNFDLAEGATALTWDSGVGGFAGDVFNLEFSASLTEATVISGGAACILSGWESMTVKFNGVTVALDGDFYSDGQWKFGLTDNNALAISKIA